MSLPDDAGAPGQARRVVREALTEWGLAHLVDDAELVVSELVTNAWRHGLPPVLLELRHSGTALRLDVTDRRPATARRELVVASQDDESGRGQGIVTAASDDDGVDVSPTAGKRVYASWDTPADDRRPDGPT